MTEKGQYIANQVWQKRPSKKDICKSISKLNGA